MVLPKIAEGFQKQKGDIFGFGEQTDSPYALFKMNPEKLEQAPIHNLDSERSVGFINYELTRRGATQLSAASSSHVKSKARDIIEHHPGAFKKYRQTVSKGGRLPEILEAWNAKQNEIKCERLLSREVTNIERDKRRNKDLEFLKSVGGPFTNTSDLKTYMDFEGLTKEEKTDRLYYEIRYARDISLSLPRTSDIFKLRKNHKKLDLDTYARNLSVYLEKVSCKADATSQDFKNALDYLINLD